MVIRLRFAAVLTLAACLAAGPALAQTVKERRAERKPTIDALLAEGTIGINNIGLLEYVGEELHLDVVQAENHDRLIIFRALARRMDETVNDVGARLAVRMHSQALPGTWLQSAQGRWYRK